MFERTINCTIAKDNGRAPEFIRRKEYKDKTKCYECGVSDIMYMCSHYIITLLINSAYFMVMEQDGTFHMLFM